MDDAALSCGQLLAAIPDSHVVTVFSSGPTSVRPLPEWDRLSGFFQPGDDVMGQRAIEDDDALAVVGAHGHRLGFWDEQYRQGPPGRLARLRPGAVRAARARVDDPAIEASVFEKLAQLVDELGLSTWLVPLGLWHGDHKKTARACLRLVEQFPRARWLAYEELPYRLELPDQVAERRAYLRSQGFDLVPVVAPALPDVSPKRAMVGCYRSQLPCLGPRAEQAATATEVVHLLRKAAPVST
jgi:LmbE family N-acetylglucosaminyl deacetylase